MANLDRFLRACADEIGRRALVADDRRAELGEGARAFSDAVDAATPRSCNLVDAAVTVSIDRLTDTPLVRSLRAARHEMAWIPSPRTQDDGVERALAPLNDVRDLGAVTCGLMLLDSGCDYPEHAHRPQELYLPIAGDGRWRFGGAKGYRDLVDEALVYNPPRAVHGARAGNDPLVALYILWN